MKKRETERHESYGTVTLTRATGRFDNLFGSNIETNQAIHLVISRASRGHDLGQDWIHPEQEVISVFLSPLQYAEMLTSMGQGAGTPCTIERVEGTQMEKPPEQEAEVRKVVKRFVEDASDAAAFAKGAGTLVDDILSKGAKMKAADRDALREIYGKLSRLMTDTAPFLVKQAEEHITTMVAEAKATITHHAAALGVDPGTAGFPALASGERTEEPDLGQNGPFTLIGCKTGECAPVCTCVQTPDIPDLPAREIDSLSVDKMNAAQLAEKIGEHFARIERTCPQSENSDVTLFYGSQAYAAGGKVKVSYVSYHRLPSALTLAEARAYLKGLNRGFNGRHYEFFRAL